jgi:hypothetical protein
MTKRLHRLRFARMGEGEAVGHWAVGATRARPLFVILLPKEVSSEPSWGGQRFEAIRFGERTGLPKRSCVGTLPRSMIVARFR